MKRKILKVCAMCISVGAPLIATLTQFPLWIERSSEATISGVFILFALLSAVPMFKHLGKLVKSPAAPILWGVLLGSLYAVAAIIDEMIVISFVGLISNCIGWIMYKIAGSTNKDKTEESEEAEK